MIVVILHWYKYKHWYCSRKKKRFTLFTMNTSTFLFPLVRIVTLMTCERNCLAARQVSLHNFDRWRFLRSMMGIPTFSSRASQLDISKELRNSVGLWTASEIYGTVWNYKSHLLTLCPMTLSALTTCVIKSIFVLYSKCNISLHFAINCFSWS